MDGVLVSIKWVEYKAWGFQLMVQLWAYGGGFEFWNLVILVKEEE